MIETSAIIGQDNLKEYLEQSLSTGRIPHALIISGQKDSGKYEIAKEYALKALSCPYEDHPDISFVDLRPKGVKYIETVRESVVKGIGLLPVKGDRKFIIILGADKMPSPAQNAILKAMEEPPEYATIIMLTEDISRLIPTIRSRATKLAIKPLKSSFIIDRLKQSGVPEDKASLAAGLSQGSYKKAEKLCENMTVLDMAEIAVSIIAGLSEKRPLAYFLPDMSEIYEQPEKFLDVMEIILRDVLVYKETNSVDDLIIPQWEDYIRRISKALTYERIGEINRRLYNIYESFLANVSKDTLLDLLFTEIGGNI